MMSITAMKMDLAVNRSLLNPRFDGYKLSTPHPDFSTASIPLGSHYPLQPVLESKSYALTAAKFAFNNLLSVTPSLVALIDSTGRLVLVSLVSGSVVGTVLLPQQSRPRTPAAEQLPPSLLLVRLSPSSDQKHQHLVIVADGTGSMLVVGVPLAAPAEAKVFAQYDYGQPAVVSDALCMPVGQASDHVALHLAIYTLAESSNSTTKATAAVKFHGAHLVFNLSLNSDAPLVMTPVNQVVPTWSSTTHPVLAHLSPDASTLLLATSAPIHSLSTPPPPPRPAAPAPATPTVFQSDNYTWRWHQSPTDVTIHISLAARAAKHAVQSSISATHVSLALPACCIFSHAALWAPIQPDDSLWTLEDNGHTLALHLDKRDPGTRWPQLFAHGTSGADVLETVDASEQARHVEQLGKYEAGEQMDAGEGEPPAAAPVTMNDPVEDIDLLADQSRTYVALTSTASGELVVSHTLGAYLCAATARGMCVKSDVDALVYTASSSGVLAHSATAHAFAYVQASKRDRRMSVATQAWAAVVHVSGCVYLYVFGREREGRAPQYVVECGAAGAEGDEEVVGVVAVGGEREEEGLGRLVVVVGRRVVCVDVGVLVSGVSSK